MEKMQKLNLRMQKLNFPGTHWRGLALIGAPKNPLPSNWCHLDEFSLLKDYYINVFLLVQKGQWCSLHAKNDYKKYDKN